MIQNTDFYRYMEETRKYKVLKEEEARLILSKPNKDAVVADVILRNLQFVCRLVLSWKYSSEKYGVDLMDLASAGNIGLIKGTVKYNSSKGSYFWYITRYIKGFIKSEFYKSIGLTRGSKGMVNSFMPLDKVVSDNGEDEPLALADVISSKEDEQRHVSLDINNLLSELRNDHKAAHRLSQEIVELRYGVGSKRHCKPLSLFETAKILKNISKEGVRKIEQKTLKYLKSA
jgi:RNA polymerase sigma factor (sigma-70 family)